MSKGRMISPGLISFGNSMTDMAAAWSTANAANEPQNHLSRLFSHVREITTLNTPITPATANALPGPTNGRRINKAKPIGNTISQSRDLSVSFILT
jgi:hypothetical protein